MTALQMLVSCAMFAPGVMAPRIGIDAATLGLYATVTSVLGIFTSFAGGMLAPRIGPFRMATVCALAVLGATAWSAYAGASALLILSA